jgi:hypothetical protein
VSPRAARHAVLGVAFATVGCDASCPQAPPAPLPGLLRLRYAGCAEVDRGPVCRLTADAVLHLSIDAPEPYRVEGGTLVGDPTAEVLRVRPASGAAALTVFSGERRATLALATVEPHPPLESITDKPPPAALTALEAARPNATPALAARLDFQIGRLSNRTGDVPARSSRWSARPAALRRRSSSTWNCVRTCSAHFC